MNLIHLNCGILHAPPNLAACCHCLLIEHDSRLVLIDTGIGLADIVQPQARIGEAAIVGAGFQFHPQLTAARQIERLGFDPSAVSDIVLTHADPDHVGGLADFSAAIVHLAEEELVSIERGHPRYSSAQFAHSPRWVPVGPVADRWYGLESRPLGLKLPAEVRLVPLFGHTLGHCGVAIGQGGRWLLHVGDAYYLRVELATDDHPVSQLATLRADDDSRRRASLTELRRLHTDHTADISLFGYHDLHELAG